MVLLVLVVLLQDPGVAVSCITNRMCGRSKGKARPLQRLTRLEGCCGCTYLVFGCSLPGACANGAYQGIFATK